MTLYYSRDSIRLDVDRALECRIKNRMRKEKKIKSVKAKFHLVYCPLLSSSQRATVSLSSLFVLAS